MGIETAVTVLSQDELGFPGSSNIGGIRIWRNPAFHQAHRKARAVRDNELCRCREKRQREDQLDE